MAAIPSRSVVYTTIKTLLDDGNYDSYNSFNLHFSDRSQFWTLLKLRIDHLYFFQNAVRLQAHLLIGSCFILVVSCAC